MIVVTDTSPLILLTRLGLHGLLEGLYGRIVVPGAVHRELTAQGSALPGSSVVLAAPRATVVDYTLNDPLLASLSLELDRGEATALALGRVLAADLVLMDERQGRLVARRLSLAVKGTLGVLVAAKREGLVDAARPFLDALSEQGAWLSPAVRMAALTAAGEEDSS